MPLKPNGRIQAVPSHDADNQEQTEEMAGEAEFSEVAPADDLPFKD